VLDQSLISDSLAVQTGQTILPQTLHSVSPSSERNICLFPIVPAHSDRRRPLSTSKLGANSARYFGIFLLGFKQYLNGALGGSSTVFAGSKRSAEANVR
jgi:hypothetical protein